MSNEFVALIANTALTLSVIVAVVFGIAQVKNSAKDRRERLTLDTLKSFHTHEFAELLHFTNQKQAPITNADRLSWSKEEQIQFINLLQQMEGTGLLLAEKLISIDLLDKTLGSFISTTWEKYKPIVLEIREKYEDPFMGEYFQWMAEQIEKRMQQKPRKPFFTSKQNAV